MAYNLKKYLKKYCSEILEIIFEDLSRIKKKKIEYQFSEGNIDLLNSL